KLAAEQRRERGVLCQPQVGRSSLDLAFPFVARKRSRRSDRLDGLNVAVAAAAHPQHQALLVQRVLVGIEIDRDLGRALGTPLFRSKQRNFLESRKTCRGQLEFYFDFFGSWHGATLRLRENRKADSQRPAGLQGFQASSFEAKFL